MATSLGADYELTWPRALFQQEASTLLNRRDRSDWNRQVILLLEDAFADRDEDRESRSQPGWRVRPLHRLLLVPRRPTPVDPPSFLRSFQGVCRGIQASDPEVCRDAGGKVRRPVPREILWHVVQHRRDVHRTLLGDPDEQMLLVDWFRVG